MMHANDIQILTHPTFQIKPSKLYWQSDNTTIHHCVPTELWHCWLVSKKQHLAWETHFKQFNGQLNKIKISLVN